MSILSKSKKEEFSPPTVEEVSKRKVYGGGSVSLPPTEKQRQGRGWHRDNLRHADVARESWRVRREGRVTPESSKKKKIEKVLMTDYNEGYLARLRDPNVGKAGVDKDIEIIAAGSRIESKHIKNDAEIMEEGRKESTDVGDEKIVLEKKIRAYEDKEDNKFRKEAKEEIAVKDKRENAEAQFDRDIKNAKDTIDLYRGGTEAAAGAARREKEIRDTKERQKREDEEKAVRITAAQQRGKKEKKTKEQLGSLRASLSSKRNELNTLERDKSKAEEAYKSSVAFYKREHPEYSDKQVEDLTDTRRNDIKRIDTKIEDVEGKINTTQREVITLDRELSDLMGVKETTGQKGADQGRRPSDSLGDIRRRQQERQKGRGYQDRDKKDKTGEQKKVPVGKVPKEFHARYPGQTDQQAWEKIDPKSRDRFLKHRKLDDEYYKKYPQEESKHEDRTEDTSTRRDPDVPLDFKGTDREWNAMSRTERVNWRTKHPKSGSTAKPSQSEPKGYKDYSELPYELKSSRNVNAALIDQYKQRHPMVRERLTMSDKGLEFADEEVLDGYLKIVVKGNSQDIRDEKEFLANNILYNRTEYNRVNNTNY